MLHQGLPGELLRQRRLFSSYVSRFVEEQGGLAYARNAMHDLAREAESIARTVPAGDERDALIHLIRFVVTRKK